MKITIHNDDRTPVGWYKPGEVRALVAELHRLAADAELAARDIEADDTAEARALLSFLDRDPIVCSDCGFVADGGEVRRLWCHECNGEGVFEYDTEADEDGPARAVQTDCNECGGEGRLQLCGECAAVCIEEWPR